MEQFLQKVKQTINHEDPIVQDFIGYTMHEFPYIPSELVNAQLEKALDVDLMEDSSVLIYNSKNVDEQSIPILVKLLEIAPRERKHLVYKFVQHLSTELLVKHASEFGSHVQADFIERCQGLLEMDEEALWETFAEFLNALEESSSYNHQLFMFAKRVQARLIEKGYYDTGEVALILRDELQNKFFSYNGILAVRAVGLMGLTEHIDVLASLLVRNEDILLEETAEALSRFQSDQVVQAVAPYMKNEDSSIFATSVLKETKSPLAVDVLVDAYSHGYEREKEIVLAALIAQFSEKAFPLIEDFLAHDYWGGLVDVEEMLYSFYKIMGREHPLMAEWKREIEEKEEHMKEMESMSFDDKIYNNLTFTKRTPVTVSKVGRNDPCPCGSGKKYKKCCG